MRKAQKAIPTGLVYRQNEVTLDKIGYDKLQVGRHETIGGQEERDHRQIMGEGQACARGACCPLGARNAAAVSCASLLLSWLVGQQWLEERDWSEVKNNYRVDRRTVPILSTAQDLIQGRTPDTPADQIKVAGAVRGYDEDEVGRARVAEVVVEEEEEG